VTLVTSSSLIEETTLYFFCRQRMLLTQAKPNAQENKRVGGREELRNECNVILMNDY